MVNVLKILSKTFYYVLLFLLIISSFLILIFKFDAKFSVKLFDVVSASMEPTIEIGSLIFVVSQKIYALNDIVTFTSNNQTITHRITRVMRNDADGLIIYETKGDANDSTDQEAVDHLRVVGKVVFLVPLAGYFSSFAKTQLGLILLVIVPATLIVFSEILNIGKIITK